ncbi:MAG: bifunctional folylpolyglutamate synthase/dihydrofolate synthase [Bacteroidetes bacterium]|nr:bifunctional folylpolyglutamate synthase/dihydrofolate synthase [Bacteroidota bacterium]
MTKEAYQQALDWLFVQMPNYQTEGIKAYKPGLDNITKLCSFFGNPQDKIQCIHIGGTNGKGSTSNMLASILQESGYKVGLYNSPHLVEFTERIKVNGQQCPREFVYNFIQKLKSIPEDIQPSFFEFTTIMAFEYFKQQKVDFAIIEVGLGGRLDATNIIHPLVTAITNVDLDHQNILGNTLEEIAQEKAGIIKPQTPIICGDEKIAVQKIVQQQASKIDADYINATTLTTTFESDLLGNYQDKNKKVVYAIVQALRNRNIRIEEASVISGFKSVVKNTGFIGRWFHFSKDPLIICDTAHNQAGLEMVFEQLNQIDAHKKIVLGFVNDKKIDEVLAILPKNEDYFFVKPSISRGRHPQDYEDLLQKSKIRYQIFDEVQSGYLAAKQSLKNNELIFIGGSNFVVGEFLEKNLPQKK